jgi:hypothetical protein
MNEPEGTFCRRTLELLEPHESDLQLPPEVWLHVFSFLSFNECMAASVVSKLWRSLVFMRKRTHVIQPTCVELEPLAQENSASERGRLTGEILKILGKCCPALRSIEIKTWAGNEQFQHLPPQINSLTLHAFGCTQGTIDVIAKHATNLRSLALYYVPNHPADQLPTQLETLMLLNAKRFNTSLLNNLPNLQHLRLRSCWNRLGQSLDCLHPSLRQLELADCRFINNKGYLFLSKLTNLETLIISNCRADLTDAELEAFIPNLRQLRGLHLRSCPLLTGGGLVGLRGLSQFEALDIVYCRRLRTHQVIMSLPETVYDLNMSYCYNLIIDPTTLRWPPNLRRLNLTNCELLVDSSLSGLPTTLRHLNLTQCYRLTDGCLEHLPQGLEWLDISWCSITLAGLVGTMPACLQTLYLRAASTTKTPVKAKETNEKDEKHNENESDKKVRGKETENVSRVQTSVRLTPSQKLNQMALQQLAQRVRVVYTSLEPPQKPDFAFVVWQAT